MEDGANLPLSVANTLDDPNEKLDVLGDLTLQCTERQAPLKRITLTRSPAPWLKNDDRRQIKLLRLKLRFKAHETKAQEIE